MITKPNTLTEIVFEAIRDVIVSKAPVRETRLRLRHIGTVETDGRALRVVMPG